jgi:hypothetical protein
MRTGNGSSPLFPDGRGRGTRDAADEEPLDGLGKAGGSPDVQQAVARLLEAAAGPATEEELSEGPAIVAAFVLAVNATGPRAGKQGLFPGSRGTVGRVPVLVAGIAMAAGAAIGATATAGALPPRIQEIAHRAFGAPAPHHHDGGAPAPAPRHSPRSGQPSPGPVGGHRRDGGDPGATVKTAPTAAEPEHPKPGKADAPMPDKATKSDKANGHMKAHDLQTHLKENSRGGKNS